MIITYKDNRDQIITVEDGDDYEEMMTEEDLTIKCKLDESKETQERQI